MKAILALLILLFTSVAVAQESAPAPEPQFVLTLSITDPDGKTETRTLPYDKSVMDAILLAMSNEATKKNFGQVNPKFDDKKPISETNQPVIIFQGISALAVAVHEYLADHATAIAGESEANATRAAAQQKIRERASKVRPQDPSKRRVESTLSPAPR